MRSLLRRLFSALAKPLKKAASPIASPHFFGDARATLARCFRLRRPLRRLASPLRCVAPIPPIRVGTLKGLPSRNDGVSSRLCDSPLTAATSASHAPQPFACRARTTAAYATQRDHRPQCPAPSTSRNPRQCSSRHMATLHALRTHARSITTPSPMRQSARRAATVVAMRVQTLGKFLPINRLRFEPPGGVRVCPRSLVWTEPPLKFAACELKLRANKTGAGEMAATRPPELTSRRFLVRGGAA